MRTPHQKLLQICNMLPMVVDFLLLVCLYLNLMSQCHHLYPCQWSVDPKWFLLPWVVPHWVPHHLGVHKTMGVYHLVPCLMRRQDKAEMVIMMAMVEQVDQELYRYNRREHRHSIWELSPKTLRYSWMGQWRCLNVGGKGFWTLLSDRSHSTSAGSLRNYPPPGCCCRLVGCPATRMLWPSSRRLSRICCIIGKKVWEFNQGRSSQGHFTWYTARASKNNESVLHPIWVSFGQTPSFD